jgi:hypothetical protein
MGGQSWEHEEKLWSVLEAGWVEGVQPDSVLQWVLEARVSPMISHT